MKRIAMVLSLQLIVVITALSASRAAEGFAPAGFGQSYDEIVALAKKEGKVRAAASNPDSKDASRFFEPFEKKYGIKVEYDRARGTESRERIMMEMIGGMVEYDVLQVSSELIAEYKKSGLLAGPFEWQKLFDIRPEYVSPEKYLASAGGSPKVIVYNPDLVPEDRIPRRWEDFLDPWWQGKFAVDTRPRSFSALYPLWGKNKLLDYCRALAANKPVFKRGQTEIIAQVAAGEYPAFCGVYLSSVLRQLDRDPSAKLKIIIPTELTCPKFAPNGVLKGSKHPNAGLLLAGWLASSEGQKQYDRILFRGTSLEEDSETAKLIKAAGVNARFIGFEYTPEQEAQVERWIVEAWGFPVRKAKKKK